jgi:hypothetical protein
MSMGAAANALLAVNLTQSQALAAPPYNWTPGDVGFANFALVVGGSLGLQSLAHGLIGSSCWRPKRITGFVNRK